MLHVHKELAECINLEDVAKDHLYHVVKNVFATLVHFQITD